MAAAVFYAKRYWYLNTATKVYQQGMFLSSAIPAKVRAMPPQRPSTG
jgi:hypothetical protein